MGNHRNDHSGKRVLTETGPIPLSIPRVGHRRFEHPKRTDLFKRNTSAPFHPLSHLTRLIDTADELLDVGSVGLATYNLAWVPTN
jgi:hypothetical protein